MSTLGYKFSAESKRKMQQAALKRLSDKENHPMWTGDKVKYRALHMWVQSVLGTPDTCKNCGKSGLTGHQIHWANISGLYKRIINDWRRLCVKCHWIFDGRVKS